MPPRTKSQGESKQGLIITLVFFILATIGLGVATYFGFSEQDKYEKMAKKANDEKSVIEADRNWYKFQAMMYRSYLGKAEGMEGAEGLGTLKGQFDTGAMKGGKDKDDVTKVLKSLETTYGWNGNQPRESLEGALTTLTTKYDTLSKRAQELQTALANAKKESAQKDEELQNARNDYGDKLAKLSKALKDDFVKSDEELQKIRDEFKHLSEQREKEKLLAEQEKKKQDALLAKKESDIKSARGLAQSRQDMLDQYNTQHPAAPASMRTDWKIVRMDTRGTNPYINLGSADHVKPQLTFTIHGVGLDGRPNPQPKGTLEVVNVVGPHLSQTRITAVKDRSRDPVLENDVIYNPSWNPNLKKHVAIAGIIDLTGDGRDSLYEFMRNLERQNIVVDAYEDPKDGSMKGQINYRTDYLIVGDQVEQAAAGKTGEAQNRVAAGLKRMQDEAKKYGVSPLGLRRYLEMIGYRLPRSTREERSSLYNSDLRPDQAPRIGTEKPPQAPSTRPDR
jgi:hypothetical protein